MHGLACVTQTANDLQRSARRCPFKPIMVYIWDARFSQVAFSGSHRKTPALPAPAKAHWEAVLDFVPPPWRLFFGSDELSSAPSQGRKWIALIQRSQLLQEPFPAIPASGLEQL